MWSVQCHKELLSNGTQNGNCMYGGVRGRKTKVGRKPLRFLPTRFKKMRELGTPSASNNANDTAITNSYIAIGIDAVFIYLHFTFLVTKYAVTSTCCTSSRTATCTTSIFCLSIIPAAIARRALSCTMANTTGMCTWGSCHWYVYSTVTI